MKINLIVIITGVLIGGFAFVGFRKGFLKMILSFMALIVASILVNYISPYVEEFLEQSTPVYDMVKERCSISYDLNRQDVSMEEILKDHPMAEYLLALYNKTNKDNSLTGYENRIGDMLADALAYIILKTAAYMIAMLLTIAGISVLFIAVDIIGRLPVINGINRISGLLVGTLEGVLIVWSMYLFFIICGGYEWSNYALQMIVENKLTMYLYENNILLKFIL